MSSSRPTSSPPVPPTESTTGNATHKRQIYPWYKFHNKFERVDIARLDISRAESCQMYLNEMEQDVHRPHHLLPAQEMWNVPQAM